MLTAVETTIQAIVFVVQVTPVGTNLGLANLLWALVSGGFLSSRGAIFSALQLGVNLHPSLVPPAFDDPGRYMAWSRRCCNRSSLPLPNIWRLTSFSLLTWPSTGPVASYLTGRGAQRSCQRCIAAKHPTKPAYNRKLKGGCTASCTR